VTLTTAVGAGQLPIQPPPERLNRDEESQ
jgi:hypothetical protein